MPGLEMMVEPYGDAGVMVKLQGELDLHGAYTFDAQLRRAEEQQPELEVIDLRGLRFVDSAGLSRLVAASRRARRDHRRLVLVRGNGAVQRVLSLSALDSLFEFVRDPDGLKR